MKSSLKKIKKYLPYVALLLVAGFAFWKVFSFGSDYGANKVQVQWDKARAQYELTMRTMEDQMRANEESNRLEQSRISSDLAEANKQHAVAVATIRSQYNDRLRDSSERERVYQRQAEAGTIEQRNLASHTARLDLALTEGINVVAELSETIRLRDEQLILLGQQINNDRKLIGESDGISARPQ